MIRCSYEVLRSPAVGISDTSEHGLNLPDAAHLSCMGQRPGENERTGSMARSEQDEDPEREEVE